MTSGPAAERSSRLRRGAVALVAILVAASCGGGSAAQPAPVAAATPAVSAAPSAIPTASPTPAPASIVVGMTNGIGGAPVAVAQARGYFKEQNLTVTWQILSTSPLMSAALAAGQVNFTLQGFAASNFNASARGLEGIAIVGATKIANKNPIMIRKASFDNGTVTKVSDLKGKKVALNATGSSTEYFLEKALRTGGLGVGDVTLVTLTFPDMVTALSTGAIDGALLVEPDASRAQGLGVAHRLVDNYLPDATTLYLFTDKTWASAHKDAVVRFIKAYRKGIDTMDMKNDGWRKGDLLPLLADFMKQPKESLQALDSPIIGDGAIDVNLIMDMQQFFMSRGLLTYTTPIAADKVVDTSYFAEYLAREGRK